MYTVQNSNYLHSFTSQTKLVTTIPDVLAKMSAALSGYATDQNLMVVFCFQCEQDPMGNYSVAEWIFPFQPPPPYIWLPLLVHWDAL